MPAAFTILDLPDNTTTPPVAGTYLETGGPEGSRRIPATPAGIGAAAEIVAKTPATIYVDVVNGSDGTGARGRRDKPFAGVVAAANASQEGDTIMVAPGTYNCASSVILKTGVKLIGAGRDVTILRLANAANTWLIRNADPVAGNGDIVIRDITVDGNNLNNTVEWDFGQVIFLNWVTNLRVEEVKIRNPKRFGLHAPGTAFGQIRNIFFDYNKATPNQDGVHANAPYFVLIENLYGDTGDDCVYVGTGEQPSVAGVPDGPYAWATGPARNVTIRNVNCPNGFEAVRIHDGNERGVEGVSNIVVDGVYGHYSLSAVILSANAPTVATRGITLRNLHCTSNNPVVEFDHLIEGLTVEDCKFVNLTAGLTIFRSYQAVPTRGLGGDLRGFVARNIYVDCGAQSATLIDARASTAKIGDAKFVNCVVRAAAAGNAGKLVLVDNAAAITALEFIDCTTTNLLRPLTIAAAMPGKITLKGCVFDGGGAAGSYVVFYDGAVNFGSLSMLGCSVTGYAAAYAFTAVAGATQSFFERGSQFSISAAAEFPFPNGAAGAGTFRFNTENARCDYLSKITPTAGDSARTTEGGFNAWALYRYNGAAWV